MADITLHYFNLYGRGELARYILHYHGTQFTDHRVEFGEWPALKSSGVAEFGQLPVLEIDGIRMVQSKAIARYLCQKFGYYPNSPTDVYWVESLVDLREDIISEYFKAKFNKDEEAINKIFSEKLPEWLRRAEARLERNNGGNGWFVGDSISLADFAVFQTVWDYLLREEKAAKGAPAVETNAPKLRAWATRLLESSPTLKHYLETRANLEA
ncbi:unnamed protein product [Blepharisma stoltei]|uniref:Glutathione S-transferase n=1 Tax=Blepharisma stoltei TaxID=1481888 RepID=A0AAU9JKC0_9CILI|nr:unnamed protein product [Blepharisma stoltei]